MRRGEAELESTSPADFNVSNRSKIFSSLSNTLFDCSSLLNFLNESCLATDGVMAKEGCVRQLGGANAVVDPKTRPSQHNRLKRSILCIDIVKDWGALFKAFAGCNECEVYAEAIDDAMWMAYNDEG
jgi:hypothetical protein